MNIRVDSTDDGRVAVAVIDGEIDLASGMQFADETLGKMPDDAVALVVDLSGLRYIDSAGVRSLFEIASALRMREQPFALTVPEGSLLRSVLKITNVEEVAPICSTLDEALVSVLPPSGEA